MKKPTEWEFLGYGRLEAPIWLIGLEEHCGSKGGPSAEEDAGRRLPLLQGFPAAMDVIEAHERYGFTPEQILKFNVPVWKTAARIAAACGYGSASSPGRSDSSVFLSELFPLPRSQHDKCWPDCYRSLYSDEDHYKAEVWRPRVQRILAAVRRHKPALVILHGVKVGEKFATESPRTVSLLFKAAEKLRRGKSPTPGHDGVPGVPSDVKIWRDSGTLWCGCANFGAATGWRNEARERLANALAEQLRRGEQESSPVL